MAEAVPPIATPPKLPKPRLRGVSHQWAFFVSVIAGAALVVAAPAGTARVVVGIYAFTVAALFGTSALYHRINWSSIGARRWMRRLDHSMIFLLIAGTYTPFAVLVLDGPLATVILIVVWVGAVGGIILKLAWVDVPKGVMALIYIALGWVALAAFPELISELGFTGGGMVIARRPALHPRGARLRLQAPRPGADRLRLSRGLPRLRDRCGRAAVRGDRVLRDPARLSVRRRPERQ